MIYDAIYYFAVGVTLILWCFMAYKIATDREYRKRFLPRWYKWAILATVILAAITARLLVALHVNWDGSISHKAYTIFLGSCLGFGIALRLIARFAIKRRRSP